MRSGAAYHPTGNHNWVQSDKTSGLVAETVRYMSETDQSKNRTERRYLADVGEQFCFFASQTYDLSMPICGSQVRG